MISWSVSVTRLENTLESSLASLLSAVVTKRLNTPGIYVTEKKEKKRDMIIVCLFLCNT